MSAMCMSLCTALFLESRSLGLQRKTGGICHLQLNMGLTPTANKYHEGHMNKDFDKRTESV